ncbi:hypothetical protein [Streptomyces sp. 11-1-2]|uniref:hypothetical protein n=1 Tax=unclassified Streptomyces TaxID=2593676 RepID=UPI000B8DA738|nr:hypothetical protein [Streptomyces sp. 11-1-2]ASQ94858.1 hypothetical protein CGL27_18930 [Streptomyces sp. 11-1-2]
MTDTPVPHESTSPAVLARSAENTEVTGVVEIAERARITRRAGAIGTTAGSIGTAAEALQPPAEDDDLVIEDLSDAAWPIGAPAICICTVGAE